MSPSAATLRRSATARMPPAGAQQPLDPLAAKLAKRREKAEEKEEVAGGDAADGDDSTAPLAHCMHNACTACTPHAHCTDAPPVPLVARRQRRRMRQLPREHGGQGLRRVHVQPAEGGARRRSWTSSSRTSTKSARDFCAVFGVCNSREDPRSPQFTRHTKGLGGTWEISGGGDSCGGLFLRFEGT